MDSVYDFWSLLKEFQIKIPMVQRDYAQGRNTAIIEDIRNNFVGDIYHAIMHDKQMNLDFVYGSTQENRGSSRKTFLPLDGQQRLTTLFLLHWYLIWKDDMIKDDQIRQILSGFQYETRISSREFCTAIVNQDSLLYHNSIEILSQTIKNEAWFFASWSKDPTINSMLNMLDSIHQVFKDTQGLGVKLLGERNNIKFRFIRLEKFGLDDSLYIKMNARGKLLTPFENFKANIEKRLNKLVEKDEISENLVKKIVMKFDTKWADLFWKYRDETSNVYDQQFLALVQTLISYHAFLKDGQIPTIGIGAKEIKYFPQKDYIRYIDVAFIVNMEKILDFFTEKFINKKPFLKVSTIFDDERIFSEVINRENVTNAKHIKFFGYCLYILSNDAIIKEEFESWMRVVTNLAENQIYNRLIDVQNSVKSLLNLAKHSTAILSYLKDDKSRVTGFFKDSIDEERLKAKLILESDYWAMAIKEAENHAYFKGQIMFLLSFCKIDLIFQRKSKQQIKPSELNQALQDFKSYYEKTSQIFYPDKLLVDENKWRRALLTKGYYLLDKSRNDSFIVNTFDRDISWKRLLNNEKRQFVKELIDDLDFKNIDQELDQIIEAYLGQNNQYWYNEFIRHPELISREFCGNNLYIRYSKPDEIHLLKSSRTSGRIREYYTTVLYLELKGALAGDHVSIACPATPGISNPDYLIFSKDTGEQIFIEYRSGWYFKYNEEDPGKRVRRQELLELLRKDGYIKKTGGK